MSVRVRIGVRITAATLSDSGMWRRGSVFAERHQAGLASSRSCEYTTSMTLSYQPSQLRLHQVLVHIKVERDQRMVRQHRALRLFEQRATLGDVRLL